MITDTSNFLNYAVMMVLMPALIATIQTLINNIIGFITNKCNKYFSSGIDIKVIYTKDVNYGDTWIPDKENNHKLINLIAKHIINSGVKYEYAECDLHASFNKYSGDEYDEYDDPVDEECTDVDGMRKFSLLIKPFEKIKLGNMTFEFYEEAPVEHREEKKRNMAPSKSSERSLVCNIKSTSGNKHVNEFLDELLKKNENMLMGISTRPQVFIQMQSDNRILFSKFSPVNNATFDNIFFDEKETLMELLDEFLAGKMTVRRLNLLLHGVPGCGKSSIIKAIANYTNFSVVVVKLSYITSDMDIFNVLFDPCICTRNGTYYIPVNKRIYVFEDIDAETNIVHSRGMASYDKNSKDDTGSNSDLDSDTELVESNTPNVPEKNEEENTANLLIKAITSSKDKKDNSKITLSGLLNALDGVIEFNSIMVMTTNYPEKLDSALTRYGRFTMKIGLTYMAPENAHKLIKYYYPEYDNSFEIPEKITPATLASYICCSRSLDNLKVALHEHNENDI
jgi:hypothetical protein